MYSISENAKDARAGFATLVPADSGSDSGTAPDTARQPFLSARERRAPYDAPPAIPPGEFRHVEHGW